MKDFTENDRYEYDLTAQSIVLDVGAHKGTFAGNINSKYGCHVMCYEPVKEFFDITRARFSATDDVCVFPYGLGREPRNEIFKIKGDMTGKFAEGPEQEVLIIGIRDEMLSLGNPQVDLIKINIEGGEYELLEAILDLNMARMFRDIQVQFHGCIPDAVERRDLIRARLSSTHHLTYDCPFIWENWRRT